MKSLYLLIDVMVISIPMLFSFHPKIAFYKRRKEVFAALLWVAVPFLILDSIFTARGIWNFNPAYLTGIYLFNLPMEEIMFFVCIPYACLFTYYCLNTFRDLSWPAKTENTFCILFSTILLLTGFIYWGKFYTSSTFITTGLFCLLLKFVFRADWFGNAVSVFCVLILPFLVVNGILTGTGLPAPVVRYNPDYHLGIRILTIPVEDFIYGFELFLLNLFVFLRLSDLPARRLHKTSAI